MRDQARQPAGMHHCSDAGFRDHEVSIPISQQAILMVRSISSITASLSCRLRSALTRPDCSHLAGAMGIFQLNALERRQQFRKKGEHLSRTKLHDSIAQSLAFIEIQVHMMRDALATEETARKAGASRSRHRGARGYGVCARLLVHFHYANQCRDYRAGTPDDAFARNSRLQRQTGAAVRITGQRDASSSRSAGANYFRIVQEGAFQCSGNVRPERYGLTCSSSHCGV